MFHRRAGGQVLDTEDEDGEKGTGGEKGSRSQRRGHVEGDKQRYRDGGCEERKRRPGSLHHQSRKATEKKKKMFNKSSGSNVVWCV